MHDEYSLFNAMDGALLDVGTAAFAESLAMNILFQEKILVNEAFFFNCPRLVDHIEAREGRESLFEAACKRGLIVPALRDPKVQSLEEADRAMSLTYGKDYKVVTPEMEPYRDRVVAAVDGAISAGITRPFYWPANAPPLGEGFSEVVKHVLQRDHPPAHVSQDSGRAAIFEDAWERSKGWRFDVVEEAMRRTKAKGAFGLQRAEIFNVLGWSMGVSKSVGNVSAEKIVEACSEPQIRLATQMFVKWVSQCHHVNQGRSFGTSINFPVYNLDTDFMVDSILRSPLDLPPEKDRGFRCAVTLPTIRYLAQAEPADLVAIRSELGHGYLHALRRWQANTTDDNQESVQKSLRLYCDNITARYKAIMSGPLEVEISNGRGGVLVKQAEKMAGTIWDIVQPLGIPILHQVTSLGSIVYRTIKTSRTRAAHQAIKQELELTLSRDLEL